MTNRDLLLKLDATVIGHTEAKKALINALSRQKIRHYQKYVQKVDSEHLLELSNVMLIGASGTGKTYLVDSLCKMLKVPFVRLDASHFNPSGASGGVKAEHMFSIVKSKVMGLQEANEALKATAVRELIDKAVIFVDEIDKISSHYEGSTGNWQEHTQSTFLSIFENKEDLQGITFVLAGAFSGLDKIKEKHTETSIGFKATETIAKPYCLDALLVDYGLIPEFVGRMGDIVELDVFDREDYKSILLDVLLPKKQREMQWFGYVNFTLTMKEVNYILDRVEESQQGVRTMKRELSKHITDKQFYYEDNNASLYSPTLLEHKSDY